MSEVGRIAQLETATDLAAVQRNFELLNRQQIGRGPAQARVYNSANISIANNTVTALTFDTERWDTGNYHDTGSNTGRLTAPTAGLYEIGLNVEFASNATGVRQARIRLNGGTAIAIDTRNAVNGAATHINISTKYQLAAGDYVDCAAFQTSGGALNVTTQPNISPEFWIVRLGSQA